MASWMIHFRIAQALLDGTSLPFARTSDVDAAFVMGNIAPDSGVPTADGTHYEPSKRVSQERIRPTAASTAARG